MNLLESELPAQLQPMKQSHDLCMKNVWTTHTTKVPHNKVTHMIANQTPQTPPGLGEF